jgi:exocyst complex protein 7
MELEKYLVLLLGLQKLLVVERQVLNEIIPSSRQNEVFSRVGMSSIDMIVKDAENITNRVMKSISKKEWSAALAVFSAMKHVSLLQPDIEKICNAEQKNQLGGVMNKFHLTGKSALDQFIESIKNESASQVQLTSSSNYPKDATVHQLTSETIWFLEHLFPYYEIIGPILAQDQIYSQPLQQISTMKSLNQEDQRNRALVGIYFRKVLTELNFTIITKADQYYNNDATRQLFKLNNIYYILKSLQRNNLLDVVKFTEVDCEKRYLKMIDDLKHAYQQTWQKLLIHITPIEECPRPSNGKLKDKDRAIVKEKFFNFNKEFDESVKNQRQISIPDLLLREGLKRDNSEAIIPHYNAFYELYADCEFAKNREKYVRYTTHHLSTLLNNLFDDRV